MSNNEKKHSKAGQWGNTELSVKTKPRQCEHSIKSYTVDTQNCEPDSKAPKRTQQMPLKLTLKHFKNLVKSTVLIVYLKDRKLLKLTESDKLFHTLITHEKKM